MFYLPLLNLVLAVAGLVLTLVTILLYVDYFVWNGTYLANKIKRFFWPIILITTIGSVVISLVYSEYFGFVPCSLCWLQRIALYPQALLVLVAVRNRENIYFPLYGIVLSLFGLVIAIYQYIYQLQPKMEATVLSLMPCLVDGSADCGVKVISEFGFVTFPFLSAVTFAFLIIIYLNLMRSS